MKTIIIAIAWAASLFVAYRVGHIVSKRFDYDAPAQYKAVIGTWSDAQIPTNGWLRHPRCREFGKFLLMRPQDSEQADLYIGFVGHPPFPAIMVSEDPKLKRPCEFSFYDAAGNTIYALDINGDGIFDALGMATTNGVYADQGLTGTWKTRMKTDADKHLQQTPR